ncbi:hypothetical protein CTA1_9475 [Colletotrichum tanaceti]|uniref:Uncharacterized protein n=1 Tax=Colletotrichum tanaceti TaxID=1306861 RepID=A0A4V6DG20_9PEZI|nr:hypothetical protein CTA1_9475 [Colletotrichum tanaceti]
MASTWTFSSHAFEFRMPEDTRAAGGGATFAGGRFLLLGTVPGHFPDGALRGVAGVPGCRAAPHR